MAVHRLNTYLPTNSARLFEKESRNCILNKQLGLMLVNTREAGASYLLENSGLWADKCFLFKVNDMKSSSPPGTTTEA